MKNEYYKKMDSEDDELFFAKSKFKEKKLYWIQYPSYKISVDCFGLMFNKYLDIAFLSEDDSILLIVLKREYKCIYQEEANHNSVNFNVERIQF